MILPRRMTSDNLGTPLEHSLRRRNSAVVVREGWTSGRVLSALREAHPVALCLALAALVISTYWPALFNGFVSYDDAVYVYKNKQVLHGLSWEGVREAFTTTEASLWHPLTCLSFELDTELFGTKPFGYHLTNVLLHAANTLLVFLVLRRLTEAPWRAAVVAALFGVHPLHVESVAWIAERKDVLSTFFFLLTIWAYTAYVKAQTCAQPAAPKMRYYALALCFICLGLMSKPMLVTIPFVLLLLDFWPLGRLGVLRWRVVLEKVPFLALSLACGIVTMFAQKGAGSFRSTTALPLTMRVENALLTCIHYLVQMVWPGRYAVFYPYPRGFSKSAVLIAGVLLTLISAAALRNFRRRPWLLFGWAWYLITLLPVLGIIQVGNQAQADRYTYIPLIGIFVMVVWLVAEAARKVTLGVVPLPGALGASAVLLCLPWTSQQIGYWKNTEKLVVHTLKVTRDNPIALNLYGNELSRQGRIDEAMQCWRAAVQIWPDYGHALGNLAAGCLKKGRYDESILWSKAAIKAHPEVAGYYSNLGSALGAKGQLDEAVAALQQSLRLAPEDPQTHANLAFAFLKRGRFDDAIAQYQATLRLDPSNRGARAGLQQAMAMKMKPGKHE